MANETQDKAVFIEQADKLHEQYNKYTNELAKQERKSNAELYTLLGSMMQMCMDIEAHEERGKLVKELRAALKEKRKIKTQANSKTAAIVAKYVTGVTRKTAHVYARVIETAMTAGVKAEELTAFITENGGIDKVRQQTAQAAVLKQERKEYFDGQIEFAREYLRKREALGVLKTLTDKRLNLRGYGDAEFAYAICRKGKGGTLEVIATVAQDEQLENYALRCLASNLKLAEFERENDSNAFIEMCEEYGASSNVVHWWMADNYIANSYERKKQIAKQLLEQQELQAA